MSNRKKIFGILSLVFGIISIYLVAFNAMQLPNPYLMIPAFILSILGIIFGGIGITKGEGSRGLAIAGIILGILGLIFPIWSLVYFFLGYY